MGLKLKTILLLLCFLDYAILVDQALIVPGGEVSFEANENSIFTVTKQSSQGQSFLTYYDITLTTEGAPYPTMYVSKDMFCQERLFVGIQKSNQIIGFIKNEQFNENFYICIKFKNNVERSSFNISLSSRFLILNSIIEREKSDTNIN